MNLDEIRLENDRVSLLPLSRTHVGNLLPIALQKGLIRYSPSKIDSEEDLAAYVSNALVQREQKTAIPFLVLDKRSGNTAGCTRFMNIDWDNRVVHIGSTWIGREFQGTGLNTEMKRLMIDFAFGELHFEKIEFRIDERNTPSRKAVEKLGAVLEGILRRNVYLTDGFKRDTCCYGLFPTEWEKARRSL
ncbi:Protein N-acetyltransferase, RimJ/RimL family [Muriicola jejuensis]|uniref:GNAT family N-acetyltransferase n=1 Tax=Muriicola jejuensis TaxID=504488 RepID=A0A6P0UH38_9FLAO|nr:GNAT family N-acetyltransferase [Muriicola jejuensis]NER11118.1 GNAT family N-acetyltransferase [Muriicola jejuensis]SMP23829.1 Protein N-acetyltransferase, RimJ/RimL family [Muriicola jejuensis]